MTVFLLSPHVVEERKLGLRPPLRKPQSPHGRSTLLTSPKPDGLPQAPSPGPSQWGLGCPHTNFFLGGDANMPSLTLVYTWSSFKTHIECNSPSNPPLFPHTSAAPPQDFLQISVLPFYWAPLLTISPSHWTTAVEPLVLSLHFHYSLPARRDKLVTILSAAESEFISEQCHRQALLTDGHWYSHPSNLLATPDPHCALCDDGHILLVCAPPAPGRQNGCHPRESSRSIRIWQAKKFVPTPPISFVAMVSDLRHRGARNVAACHKNSLPFVSMKSRVLVSGGTPHSFAPETPNLQPTMGLYTTVFML